MDTFSRSETRSKNQLVTLSLLHFKVLIFNFFERIKVVYRYYPNLAFGLADFLLTLSYLVKTPYTIFRQFFKKGGEEEVYGETPLTTLDKIATRCRFTSKDIIYDLGCGTGRTTLWLACFVKCEAIGIDHLSLFIGKAQRIKQKVGLTNAYFYCDDMLRVDLSRATAIYLCGTCMSDAIIDELCQRLLHLPRKTKIITVSFPLTDYISEGFILKDQFTGRFPWGETEIYYVERE